MQSSAVMAIRATVLLVCLVAVPVIAVCGKNAPEVVKSFLRDYTGGPAKAPAADTDSTDAPVFRPGLLAAAAGSKVAQTGGPAPLSAHDSLASAQALGNAGPPRPLSTPSSGPIAALQPRPSTNGQTGAPISTADGQPGPEVTRVGHQVENPVAGLNGSDPRIAPGPRGTESTNRFPPDYFRSAETRLRALGATYYLLETLGPTGDQYRFICKVAAQGQPQQMLAFFAVESDALAAMNNVVRQVESWRSQLNP